MVQFENIRIDQCRLPEQLRGGVVAIGNFDGLHRGHRTVIDKALKIADEHECPSILLSFDPHPRTWFNPQKPVFLLTPPSIKADLVARLGMSAMAIHRFDDAFSALSAEEFLERIIQDKIGARHVVTGEDFHFGSKRQGTPEYLMQAGDQMGFQVSLIPPYMDKIGEVISSSRIRKYLEQGEMQQANELLGYAYRVSGTVIEGKKLGRTLGFPTANIALSQNNRLRQGIFAVRAIRENGSVIDGVASYGRRPTFDNGVALFETFLFDFDEEIYGETLTVLVYQWLRSEEKFDSVDELVDQMNKDKEEARLILSGLSPDHLLYPQPVRNR